MDDRLEGDAFSCGFRFSLEGEFGSRPCQKILVELVLLLNGEEVMGEVSSLDRLFYLIVS